MSKTPYELRATYCGQFATVHITRRDGPAVQGVMHGFMFADNATKLLDWLSSATGVTVNRVDLPAGMSNVEADHEHAEREARPAGTPLASDRAIADLQMCIAFDEAQSESSVVATQEVKPKQRKAKRK